MYLVVIVVLSIVLAFQAPAYRWIVPTWQVWAAVVAATLVPPVVALLAARVTLRRLEQNLTEPGYGQAALGRGTMLVQTLLALGHVGVLMGTDWLKLCDRVPVVNRWPVIPSVLAMVPFMTSLVLVWLAFYRADRAIRQIALEVNLFRGRPVRPVWSLGAYLVYNLRHQLLFILVPMLLILLARDLIYIYEGELRALSGSDYFSDILLGSAAVAVAVFAPEILRRVWATQRLPAGPLRDRLQVLCAKLGVRCRDILVWKAGGMIVNAAVMGVVAPLRYVLITDGMLEQLDDTRIEAVFGHEAGHVKRHHILFFLLLTLITGCGVTIFSVRTRHMSPHGVKFQVAATLLGLVLLFKWGVVFGWISRRFERQADIFGVHTLELSGLPCALPCQFHGTETSAGAGKGAALCSTAAHVFGDTLNEVAVLNGIAPEGYSWRHGSISSRSRLLQKLAHDPGAAARAERTVTYVKAAILIVAAAACAWAAWDLRLWQLFAGPR